MSFTLFYVTISSTAIINVIIAVVIAAIINLHPLSSCIASRYIYLSKYTLSLFLVPSP